MKTGRSWWAGSTPYLKGRQMARLQPPALPPCSHCGSAEFTFEDGGVHVCRRCIDGAIRAAFYPELISLSGLLAIAEKHPAVELIMPATKGPRSWLWRAQPDVAD